MKYKLVFSLLTSCLLCQAQTNLDKERAMQFYNEYQLSDTNTNIADVDYARKFDDIASEKLAKKYESLGAKKQDMSKYKDLNKMQKIMDRSPNAKRNLKSNSARQSTPTSATETETKTETVIEEPQAQEYEVELGIEEVIIVDDEETMQDVIEIEQAKADEKESEEAFMQNIMFQNKVLDNKGHFSQKLQEIEQESALNEQTQMTLFYFISSDMDISNLKSFVAHINKLKNKGYDIVGRVLFRGLIGESFESIPNWIKEKEEKEGLERSGNVHYQFHPWAFDYFSLNKVPAYALSSCKIDFRFRDCEHKYLLKGAVSFPEFTEILAKNNKEYENLRLDTIDINEVIYEKFN
jgi:hypothetical protein